MQIKRAQKVDDKKQWLHVIVTIDGVDYPLNHVCNITDTDEQIQAREPEFKLDILRNLYPDAPPGARDSLEAMEKWIKNGCIVPAVTDEEGNVLEPERKAEKQPWTITWPEEHRVIDGKKISRETQEELLALVKKVPEAAVLLEIFIGRKQALAAVSSAQTGGDSFIK
ncbi:MAG: hypothetical protein JRJ66_01410 [Deltaproteobacteria bacterium]|nr:hypothetical protein [Deltaproteobacteria bacterium]MBW2081697.1 hypothetical protein [Deltaproteobacteria bacterium]MBW2298892.1 hypothetical protein [Deltaproteobacteria bacterium]